MDTTTAPVPAQADPAALLWLFLVIALGALLLWDRWGRDLWYDAVGVSRDAADWLRSRPWSDAVAALRGQDVSSISASHAQHYVDPHPAVVFVPPPFPPEREPEREPEPVWNGDPAPQRVDGMFYTFDEIERLQRKAQDEAKAQALGLLLGHGIVTEERRTTAMELLFGPRGRRWQTVRPVIDQAVAQVAAPRTPLAGRPVPAGVRFEGDADD